MNHPSEWARFFDENTGSYRYKHKGSGVIRDTFMTIGKVFKDNVKNVAKKTAEKNTKTIAEKAGQKVGEFADEKGSKLIRKLLQERKKTKTVVTGCKKETCKYFTKSSTEKIRRPCEIKSNSGKRNLTKKIFLS